MARYIDAEELKKRAYPFPCAIGVEYAVSVRQIDEAPTADVVPKSEVEMLQGALKAEERHNELTMEMAQKALANAKSEVASKIFEELEYLSMDGRIPMNGYYAELKKKYTEDKT